MKKKLLLAACVTLSAVATNAQTRMVLYEEFTGENCPSCSSANPGLDAMMTSSANAGKVFMIKYMCNIPSAGTFYYMTNTLFETGRQTYYSVPFAPFGTLDGTIPNASTSYPGFSAYLTQTDVDSAIAKPTVFKINANYKFNTAYDSVTITVHIKAMAAYNKAGASLKLRGALCKSLQFTSSPGSNGETDFINTVRGMYPDYNGIVIPNTWAAGDSQTYVLKGAVMSETSASIPHTATDTTVAVWIQNNTNKFIEQTALASKSANLEVNTAVKNGKQISVYPNPSKDQLHIQYYSEKGGEGTIYMYNYAGSLVKTINNLVLKSGANELNCSINDLSAGLYTMQLAHEGVIESTSFSVSK